MGESNWTGELGADNLIKHKQYISLKEFELFGSKYGSIQEKPRLKVTTSRTKSLHIVLECPLSDPKSTIAETGMGVTSRP